MNELIEMALSGRYDEMLDILEKMPPRMLDRFCNLFCKDGHDVYYDLEEHFTDKQLEKFKWLASTERAREYLMAIPDEKMTDQDWFDLRATDF